MAVALLLGVAAAVIGYFGLTALATRQAAANSANMHDVVVTATDLTFGVKLDKTMLRVVKYPKDAVPLGAYSTVDSVVGQTTKVFMSQREPVTSLKLSSRGGGLSMLVRPTMRAASLEVNQVSGVSGFVLPGDRVDVLVTVDRVQSVEEAFTHTILQNIEVLAAGQKTQQQDNKPITVQAVTLLVDPTGAEQLAHAQHEGTITLVLRNPEDNDTLKVASFTSRELLGQSRGAQVASAPSRRERGRERVIVQQAQPIYIQKPAPVPANVRIYRGSNRDEVPVPHDSTNTN